MIQKLKRKFILTNMLLVSVVLLVVFAALVWANYNRAVRQSADALHMALKWTEEAPPPRFEFDLKPDPTEGGRRGEGENRFTMVPVFSATVTADGAITASQWGNNVTVSDEVLGNAVSQALAAGTAAGTLPTLNLRFLSESGEEGAVRLAFADLSWEWESLQGLLLTSLLVGLGALLVFFLVSLFLAKLSLRPVERAWAQQRQFVADASHELKTPLTVILANTGILLSHKSDTVGSQAKWVDYIREESIHMKTLVEDMLFLAKSDAQRDEAARTTVDLSSLLTGTLLPFESVAFEQGAILSNEITPDLTLRGDEGQLRRLIMILLDNACKYAGQNGRVAVSLTRAQDRLHLTVFNTGVPIPAAHLPHLFERFYRADPSRNRSAGGYGLGLAIAKSIADGHGGRLSVSSTADGTTFTALLPVGK